jgi:hypothetical protein
MTGLRNSGNQVPNPDAVSQFNVVTNNYSAQLGRYSSAVVSVVTKSGTNKFHGSAFEFFRDRNFNAIGHNAGANASKTPYNQHRFGATIGGPIRHDKDFFFASFGGYRFRTSAPTAVIFRALLKLPEISLKTFRAILRPAHRPRPLQTIAISNRRQGRSTTRSAWHALPWRSRRSCRPRVHTPEPRLAARRLCL